MFARFCSVAVLIVACMLLTSLPLCVSFSSFDEYLLEMIFKNRHAAEMYRLNTTVFGDALETLMHTGYVENGYRNFVSSLALQNCRLEVNEHTPILPLEVDIREFDTFFNLDVIQALPGFVTEKMRSLSDVGISETNDFGSFARSYFDGAGNYLLEVGHAFVSGYRSGYKIHLLVMASYVTVRDSADCWTQDIMAEIVNIRTPSVHSWLAVKLAEQDFDMTLEAHFSKMLLSQTVFGVVEQSFLQVSCTGLLTTLLLVLLSLLCGCGPSLAHCSKLSFSSTRP
jgi:hypothetical protein